MTPVLPPGAAQEVPVFFPGGEHTLFGIFTRPEAQSNGIAAVMLPGARHPGTTERNRLSVRVCRTLAGAGYHALRLDYHGTGESTGVVSEGFLLHRPFTQDVEGAVRWIRDEGLDRFLLMGSCFGSRTALAAATTTDGVVGLVLLSAPPGVVEVAEGSAPAPAADSPVARPGRSRRRDIRRLFSRRARAAIARRARARWRGAAARVRRRSGGDSAYTGPSGGSGDFVRNLGAVVKRGIPILFIYGQDDEYYRQFRHASAGRLGRIIQDARSDVEVRVLPGRVYGFTQLAIQDDVLALVEEWAQALAARSTRGGER